jgi:hypothetical protein
VEGSAWRCSRRDALVATLAAFWIFCCSLVTFGVALERLREADLLPVLWRPRRSVAEDDLRVDVVAVTRLLVSGSCVLGHLAATTSGCCCVISVGWLSHRGSVNFHPHRCGSGCTGMLVMGRRVLLSRMDADGSIGTLSARGLWFAMLGDVGSGFTCGTS